MKATDLESFIGLSRPSADPRGERVVVSVGHPSLAADANVAQLFSVPLDGSGPRRITRGFRDSDPQFSPDGHAIAFLRAGPGSPAQLYVMPSLGGEPVQVTDRVLGVSDIRWSPDSHRIAFISRVPEAGRYGTVDGIPAAAEPARRVTGVTYKSNGLGYTNDRRAHVFIVTVPPLDGEPPYEPVAAPDGTKPAFSAVPEATQLTSGDYDHASVRWAGERIYFVSARHDTRDTDLYTQVFSIAPEGSEVQEVTGPGYAVETFDVAADGRVWFIAAQISGNDFVARNNALFIAGQTSLGSTRLTDPETIDLGDVGTSIAFRGDGALVQNRSRGTRQLLEVREPNLVSQLSSGAIEIEGQATSGEALVVTYASPETFGDVGLLAGGVVTRLTDFSSGLSSAGLLAPSELLVEGRDGYEVHGWVLTPRGEGPHPTLLMIHGGPYAAYSVHPLDEAQVYADAGYAVVYCNPRGSAGYGQAHGRSIKGIMGTIDQFDVLDFLDGALAADPALDASRLGILGGSYGGYLTAFTIAHDHRFAAAIVERGYLDPDAFIGSSDIGWFFGQEYNGYTAAERRAQSPQEVAHLVTTPTLVIHSEEDLRCPIGQAETWYATVKLGGTPAELLVFPGENHELSRSGRPRHRVQRFEAILDWFGRYL